MLTHKTYQMRYWQITCIITRVFVFLMYNYTCVCFFNFLKNYTGNVSNNLKCNLSVVHIYLYFFFLNYSGGGSPPINAYLRGKLKVFGFENGQCCGHLIFDKKLFWEKKKTFHPDEQDLCFFEKKTFSSFFLFKCFFWKCFFEKILKKF